MKLSLLKWFGIAVLLLLCIGGFLAYRAVGGIEGLSAVMDASKIAWGLLDDLEKIDGVSRAQVHPSSITVDGKSATKFTISLTLNFSCKDEKSKCEEILAKGALTTIKGLQVTLTDDDQIDMVAISASAVQSVTKTVKEWREDPTAKITN